MAEISPALEDIPPIPFMTGFFSVCGGSCRCCCSDCCPDGCDANVVAVEPEKSPNKSSPPEDMPLDESTPLAKPEVDEASINPKDDRPPVPVPDPAIVVDIVEVEPKFANGST